MKKLLATTALSLVSFGALAADLPARAPAPAPVYVAPVFSWAGAYVGVSGGWGSAKMSPSFMNDGYETNVNGIPFGEVSQRFAFDQCTGTVPSYWAGGSFSYCGKSKDADGWFGGVQAGYNFQSGNIVYGVEADAFLANIDGSGQSTWDYQFPRNNYGDTTTWYRSSLDAFGTIRLRAGYAVDRFLVYVTGGAAWGSVEVSANSYNSNNLRPDTEFSGKRSDTRWGWAVGGGVEYAFTNNLTAKVEYMYIDLGSQSARFAYSDGGPYILSDDMKLHTVKVGVNYKFGGSSAAPVVARY